MRFTLITSDHYASVDGVIQIFDYSSMIDPMIAAVQWYNTYGDVEYLDVNTTNDPIYDMSPYQPIIDEYYRRQDVIVSAVEQVYDVIEVVYLSEQVVIMTRAQCDTEGIVYEPITTQDAYATKENEITEYAEVLIAGAYGNPMQGVTTNADYYHIKVTRRRTEKSDQISAGDELDQAQKDEAKSDQKLSEYETKITADQDKAYTNLYKLDTVDEVMAFDVAAQNWNVWVPPV